MRFNIDPKIFEQNPNLKLGVILVKGIDNGKRISAIESLLRGVCAQRKKEFEEKDIDENPMIRVWDEAYGWFGINPKKNPCSIAALLKRIKAGKEIPHINSIVDLYNYFSLKYLLPIGGEDMDWICGDLNLTFTKGGEPFRPIGSIEVERAGEGEIAYMDDAGITCRYWNHRECERTKFTQKTTNAAIIIEDLSKMHMDEFGRILREIQNAIIKYIGGQIEPYIMTEEKCSIDMGIKGRKNMDDSKIPQQEIAHILGENFKKKGIPEMKKIQTEPKKTIKSFFMAEESLLKSRLILLLKEAVIAAYGREDVTVKMEYPMGENFGDYASNIAMQLGKELNLQPREAANKIIENIPKNDLIEKTEIAGPGFINLHISKKTFEHEIEKVLEERDAYGTSNLGKDKTIVIDYSQPNIAKPLGVHHLLSTIIGQSLNNIYKNLGYNLVGINYIGDWGTQFGKLTYAYRKWGDREIIEKNPIAELLKLYVRFHEEAEKDHSLEDEARKEFKKLEDKDEENTKLWEWFCKVSLEEVARTYEFLGGIHFDYIQGESFLNDKMEEILERGKKENIFVKGEEGSWIVKFEGDKYPPYLVQKSDGATLYSTRDLAAINYREKTWHPEKILYVVDVAQSLHFDQLFETAKLLNMSKAELIHVVFGRMQFKDKEMSTRKGNIVLLDEVLKEAVKKAQKIVEEKNPNLADEEKIARSIGVGAVKYAVLSQNRTTNIVFDWEKMLSLEGNSAPYLQYSYARAKSILRKAKNPETEFILDRKDEKIEEKTMEFMRTFPKFKEQIILAAEDYKPNILCNYLYEFAQKFNSFYNCVPVLVRDENVRNERLKLVEAASQILKNGLTILGVEVVEEM